MAPQVKFDLERQSTELPGTRRPGETGIYRNAKFTNELVVFANPQITTLYENFMWGLKTSRDNPCIGHRPLIPGVRDQPARRGPYVWQTYKQVEQRITNFGSGLLRVVADLNLSQQSGFHVGIWAVNRPEWFITDNACYAYSLCSVALYDTLGADTVEYVVNHADLEIVITSADHIPHLLRLSPKIPRIKLIISMDTLDRSQPNGSYTILNSWAQEKGIRLYDFTEVEAIGQKSPQKHIPPKSDDITCIMYTSGTTGVPKGAMITHRNFLTAISSSFILFGNRPDDVFISYLPLAHIFGKCCDISAVNTGGRIGYYSGDVNTLMDDIQELKPTIFLSVPRLLNRVYAKLVAGTIHAPGLVGILARRAVADKLRNLEAGLGFTHPLWDRLLFSKAKMALGGRCRIMLTGSAPIAKDILSFLRIAFCCDVREGYGATEGTAMAAINLPGEFRPGNVGAPAPCCEIKLVDVPEMNYLSTDPYPRGELCVRGGNVFKGYYKDPEKTREALDKEGWCHSGDIAIIDERGSFTIIDRKKNIFKLAQGEYIAPEKIENIYLKNTLLAQIYVHGDSLQNCLVAIVVPDPEGFVAFGQKILGSKLSFEELVKNERLKSALLHEMDKVGKEAKLRGFEFVKAIHLTAEPFSIENDLLTPTFKIKRPQAAAYFKQEIKALYDVINGGAGVSNGQVVPKAKL